MTTKMQQEMILADYVAHTLYHDVKMLDDGDAEEMANWLIDRVVKALERDPRLPQLQWTGWHQLLEGVCDEATSKLMELVCGKIDRDEAIEALDRTLPRKVQAEVVS